MSRLRRKLSWLVEGHGYRGVYRARHRAGAVAAFRREFGISRAVDRIEGMSSLNVTVRLATLAEANLTPDS